MTYPIIDIDLGNGLRVRQIELSNAVILFERVTLNRARLRQRLTWVDSYRSLKNSQNYIETARQLQQLNGAPTAGIWLNDELIGIVGLHTINWANGTGIFGYWLDGDHEGQGIMTRAAIAMRDFAFNQLGLKRLEIVSSPNNHASHAVAKKLGFILEPGTQAAIWSRDPHAQMEVYAGTPS